MISTHPIKGYLVNQKRQGSYHRISEIGISCLREQGVPVERRADQLRINIRHLPFLLSTNDVMIDLEAYGWQMKDSRKVKEKFELNRGANVQGMLKSPRGTELPLLYVPTWRGNEESDEGIQGTDGRQQSKLYSLRQKRSKLHDNR